MTYHVQLPLNIKQITSDKDERKTKSAKPLFSLVLTFEGPHGREKIRVVFGLGRSTMKKKRSFAW
jgi:hypothetical protein